MTGLVFAFSGGIIGVFMGWEGRGFRAPRPHSPAFPFTKTRINPAAVSGNGRPGGALGPSDAAWSTSEANNRTRGHCRPLRFGVDI